MDPFQDTLVKSCVSRLRIAARCSDHGGRGRGSVCLSEMHAACRMGRPRCHVRLAAGRTHEESRFGQLGCRSALGRRGTGRSRSISSLRWLTRRHQHRATSGSVQADHERLRSGISNFANIPRTRRSTYEATRHATVSARRLGAGACAGRALGCRARSTSASRSRPTAGTTWSSTGSTSCSRSPRSIAPPGSRPVQARTRPRCAPA